MAPPHHRARGPGVVAKVALRGRAWMADTAQEAPGVGVDFPPVAAEILAVAAPRAIGEIQQHKAFEMASMNTPLQSAPVSARRRILRLWRHLWQHESQRVVSDAVAARLQAALAQGELAHLGEVRICVEAALPLAQVWAADSDSLWQHTLRERALHWFSLLQVWDTAQNSGVLIHLLLAERHIEIVADRGLAVHVAPEQWQAVVLALAEQLRQGAFEAGLSAALQAVNALLVQHFPAAGQTSANPNELPDLVVRV